MPIYIHTLPTKIIVVLALFFEFFSHFCAENISVYKASQDLPLGGCIVQVQYFKNVISVLSPKCPPNGDIFTPKCLRGEISPPHRNPSKSPNIPGRV